eukprot:COSAG02_NODE_1561_length_11924_cov_12.099281_3_plen_100_part_00
MSGVCVTAQYSANHLPARLQNSLLVQAGQTESFDALRGSSGKVAPSGLFGANSTWKRNMSFFSAHQAKTNGSAPKLDSLPQSYDHEEAMQLALLEVDGG